MIKVRVFEGGKIKVKLKPEQGVKVGTDTTYLYDPTIIDAEVQQAKDWAIKTDGMVEEDGEPVDYSAKAYAIGGTGTQTNNSKYYAEQAAISETNASNSATSASSSASAASSSAALSKDWATKTDGKVDGNDYSAKYYAQQITPIASDITTVAGIASNVTTVAGISSDITSVAGNATNINTVSSHISNVNLVAGDISNVNTVANDISTIVDVADNKTNIDAVAGNASNINAVVSNSSNINSVAGNATNINAVAGNSTNINAVASDLTNIDAVANDLTNIDNASTYANNANIWAEGTDIQVAALGGEKSSKGWAARAKELVDLSAYRTASDQDTIDAGKVPTSRTVNGKALSSNISLTHSDVGAVEANESITGATKCKITYDSKGLVTAGSDLQASDIPSLTISKISDITATASEINVLDGITASTAELNYTDGVTSNIQTQLNGKQPTGNYMTTDTVQDVGGGATKTFNGRVNFIGAGDSKAIYLSTDTRIDVYGTSRTVLGFENGTFLINHSSYPLNLRGSGARPAWNGTSYLALTSDIGNATLTIQKNGTDIATFTANSSTNKTANIIVPTKTSDLTNDDGFITGITSGDVTTALGYTPYDSSNPNGYTSNVGTVTSVNNVSPVGGNVTISIPTVDQSYDGTSANAQSGVAVKSAIDSAISSVYKPAGSVAFASLPALSSSIEGYVYNVTDSFTTTSDFVEGAGKTYPAGTNVVCIDVGSSVYKWDVLSGMVDLSGYVPTSRTINNKALTSNISLTASDVGALPDSTVIPTVNNATLTIQKNGTNVATFTANSSSNKTANITVPTDTGDLTNGAGFITGITSSDVTTALGYTPYDSSNPSGYTTNVGTVTSVNNTSPVNGNVSLSIPTVNNPTITITQGGTTKGSFTLNQSSGATIALDAGGGSSLPSQTGHSGEFLTTDGTDASWTGITIPTVNDATLTIQKNGTSVGTFSANASSNSTVNITVPDAHNLFDFKWTDYELNDQSWLRADTFSWQDGTVYSEAYNHLVTDYNGGTSQTETIGSYTITYVLATDGHKITTDETNVANIYNESGVAWYYILDTANQRFKLPRGLHGTVVQRYQNGENWYRIYSDGWCEQGGVSPSAGDQTNNTIILLKSYKDTNYSILFSQNAGVEGSYTNGCTAKNKTTSSFVLVYRTGGAASFYWQACGYISGDFNDMEKYLYFYVGQFSQSATEQTAGLNSELFNGKMDLDLGNATQVTKDTIVGWGIPDYASGVAKTSGFVAEYDGCLWVETVWLYSTPAYVTIDNVSHKIGNGTSNGSCAVSAMFIIGKGSTVSYSNIATTIFYPLKGVNNA